MELPSPGSLGKLKLSMMVAPSPATSVTASAVDRPLPIVESGVVSRVTPAGST